MTLNATFTDATLVLNANAGEVQFIQTVKPIPQTAEMTQPVGVDENGRLYTFPSSTVEEINVPTIELEPEANGVTIVVTDPDGQSTAATITNGKDGRDGKDGASPTIELSPIEDGVTIVVTDPDGKSMAATITNGKDGQNGKNGVSPKIELLPIEDGVEISVTTPNSGASAFIYNGESAYDIARNEGFEGTEAEWLETLKGEKGDNGAKGDKGDKGDTGAQGPKGDVGPAYTLTAADKSAIATAVQASLSVESWIFTLTDGSTVTKAVYVK